MNYLDLIILVPVAWLAYTGFRRGLVIEVASLAALLLGIYGAIKFSGFTADWLKSNLGWDFDYLQLIAFILTFILVVVLVHFLGRLLEKIVNMAALGFLNKGAGALFGAAKGVVLMSLIIWLFTGFKLDVPPDGIKKESFLYRHVEVVAPWIWNQLKEQEWGKKPLQDIEEKAGEFEV
ncbi:MAG: hypothetical protein Kow00127_06190 [Bacteroidales bacterium]